MNNLLSIYVANAILVAVVTIAFFNGHASSATHFAVIGSLIASPVLASVLRNFK